MRLLFCEQVKDACGKVCVLDPTRHAKSIQAIFFGRFQDEEVWTSSEVSEDLIRLLKDEGFIDPSKQEESGRRDSP